MINFVYVMMKGWIFVFLTIIYLDISTTQEIESKCRILNINRDDSLESCADGSLCNDTYTMILYNLPPYSGFEVTPQVFQRCCGECFNVTEIRLPYGIYQMDEIEEDYNPDLFYPVLEKYRITDLYGYKFIPFLRFPGFIYLTIMQESAFQHAIHTCLNLYPLFLIALLMSLIFGFLIWIAEMKGNPSEFPQMFPLGWIKGVWWSTIALVSIGPEFYPKSIIARILSVFWLIIAVVMVSLVTSIITATMARPAAIPTMEGKTVATLHSRKYNDYIILKNGGKIKTFPDMNYEGQFSSMFESLLNKTVDGILADENLMQEIIADVYSEEYLNHVRSKYFSTYTVQTKIKDVEEMHYGILVKDIEVYHYFHDAFTSNWLQFEKDKIVHVNEGRSKEMEEIRRKEITRLIIPPVFSLSEPYVKDGLIYLSVIVAVLCTFGAFYEIYRRIKTVPNIA